jgi:hypothetical protein
MQTTHQNGHSLAQKLWREFVESCVNGFTKFTVARTFREYEKLKLKQEQTARSVLVGERLSVIMSAVHESSFISPGKSCLDRTE